jgi:DNA-binding transcriptional LysR family regulator
MYDLRHIEHAVAVAEHGGFRRAARALGLSQPALSRSVQQLERSLGVRLFDRDRRGLRLTVFGSVLVERGRSMIKGRGELERELRLLQGLEVGELSLGFGPYPAALSGHAAVARLLARHPGIRCGVGVADWRRVTGEVIEGVCDLGLADLDDAEGHDGLETEPIATHPVRFFCRPDHELLSRGKISLQDLTEYPWAGTLAPPRMAELFSTSPGRAGRVDRAGRVFVPAVRLDAVAQIGEMARDSDVLVAATLTMVEGELASGELAVVPFAADWLRLSYGIIRLRGRTPSPAETAFLTAVREIEVELVEREAALQTQFL